jgi:hypothetical protein
MTYIVLHFLFLLHSVSLKVQDDNCESEVNSIKEEGIFFQKKCYNLNLGLMIKVGT